MMRASRCVALALLACAAAVLASSASQGAAPIMLEPGVLSSLSTKSLRELLAKAHVPCPKCKSKQDLIAAVM